ncbi:DUF5673 domain-containing protein [Nostoc sp. MS1]|uniref:DUF5673 domain-containing protein n=1 Tax=Nostoc sp. MS1 TaxID=2764711 RepID=UPI001CC405D1|nr:DUF5673 domain-containing protein [Nostoc sp. MS1]BCL33914.1 hypothetical protein NSMS1_03610 [Nostoc sp. MS1]
MNTYEFTHVAAVSFPIIIFFILLGIRYQVTRRAVGEQNANREILYTIPWILFVFAVLVIPQLTKYGWLILLGIYEVYFLGYLIYISTWQLRKEQAGYCLLNVGWLFKNKRLVWLSLFSIMFASLYSALFIHEAFKGNSIYDSPYARHLAETVLIWSSIILLISRCLVRLELRENGICYMFSLVEWARVKSYSWEQAKNGMLVISFQPRLPFAKNYWRISIPVSQKDAVNQILAQYIDNQGNKNLLLPKELSYIN